MDEPDEKIKDESEKDDDTYDAQEPDSDSVEAGDDGDEEPAEDNKPKAEKTAGKGNPMARMFGWLKAKPKRMVLAVVGTIVVVAGLVIGLTDLRYLVVGAIWKADVTLRVVDMTSTLPVPHTSVTLAGKTQFTDKTGAATFKHLQPGKTTMNVSRSGYATLNQAQTVGFGDVALGTFKLKATGVPVVAVVTNALAGGFVEGVEVKAGDVQATTDSKGMATLIFPPTAINTSVDIEYSKDGFNTLKTSDRVGVGIATLRANLVADGKVYYLSNRNGKIDLYESNLDGSVADVVLEGTGNEDTDTGILPNDSNPLYLAIVSSREGKRDQFGNSYHMLYIFNTLSQKLTKVEGSFAFNNFRAWIGSSLVYQTNAVCGDLKAYDAVAQKSTTILAAGSGCPQLLAPYDDGFFYSYSGTNSDKDGIYFGELGKAAKHIATSPAASIIRQTKQKLLAAYYYYTPTYTTEWQSIDLESLVATKLPQGPANNSATPSRAYNDSPNGKLSSFIEERDGKTELYLTDGNGANEKKLTSIGSVNQFVGWFANDYVVFSVSRSDENALYVVAVNSGKVTKVADFYRANARTYGGGYNPQY